MTQPEIRFIFNNPSQFVALTGASPSLGYCTPDLVLADEGTDKVTLSGKQNPDGSYPCSTATIGIPKGKAPNLRFTVVDQGGNPLTYTLGGVALKPAVLALRLAAAAPCGAFPKIEVDFDKRTCASTLTLHTNNASGSGLTYDFWVLVQNSNGDAGLIDPRIVNEP